MSETPRVSALISKHVKQSDSLPSEVRLAKLREHSIAQVQELIAFARQLERELNCAQENFHVTNQAYVKADAELTQAQARCAEMRIALERSRVAIDDWINTYASEMCDEKRVKEAYDRIGDAGGTLAYIAKVQQANRSALKG